MTISSLVYIYKLFFKNEIHSVETVRQNRLRKCSLMSDKKMKRYQEMVIIVDDVEIRITKWYAIFLANGKYSWPCQITTTMMALIALMRISEINVIMFARIQL